MAARRSAFEVDVASGDRRKALEAIRDRLAGEMKRAEGAAVAALSRQLTEVLGQLDAIKEPEVSARDDLARRRAARRADAKVQGAPDGADVGGT